MRRVTINIPDNKYHFFRELVKNLGLEKVKEEPSDTDRESNTEKAGSRTALLRVKLKLSNDQYKDFQQFVKDGRY